MFCALLLGAALAADITMQNCYDNTCRNCDATFMLDTSNLQTSDASSCSDWKQAIGMIVTPVLDGQDFDWGVCVEIDDGGVAGYGIYNSCHETPPVEPVFASTCKNSTCFTTCIERKDSQGARRRADPTAAPTSAEAPTPEHENETEISSTMGCMEECYDDSYPWLREVSGRGGVNQPWQGIPKPEPLFSCNGTTATSVWPGEAYNYPKGWLNEDVVVQNASYACGSCEMPNGYGPKGDWLMEWSWNPMAFMGEGKVVMNFSDVNYTMDLTFDFDFSASSIYVRDGSLEREWPSFAFECKNEPYKLKPARNYYNGALGPDPTDYRGLQLLFVKDGVVNSECLRSNFAKHSIEMLEHPIWLEEAARSSHIGLYEPQIWMTYGVSVPWDWNVTNTTQECQKWSPLAQKDCEKGVKTFYVNSGLQQLNPPTPSPICWGTGDPAVGGCGGVPDDQSATGLTKSKKSVIFVVAGCLLAVVVLAFPAGYMMGVVVACGPCKNKKTGVFDASCGLAESLVQSPKDHKGVRRLGGPATPSTNETPV